MAYKIAFTHTAGRQLRALKAHHRCIILHQHSVQLSFQPTVATRNRKPLRVNAIAPWELRIGPFRIFYAVEEPSRRVHILAIGLKDRHRVLVDDEAVRL